MWSLSLTQVTPKTRGLHSDNCEAKMSRSTSWLNVCWLEAWGILLLNSVPLLEKVPQPSSLFIFWDRRLLTEEVWNSAGGVTVLREAPGGGLNTVVLPQSQGDTILVTYGCTPLFCQKGRRRFLGINRPPFLSCHQEIRWGRCLHLHWYLATFIQFPSHFDSCSSWESFFFF